MKSAAHSEDVGREMAMTAARAYFNVQLVTICAVVKSNFQCKMCSFCQLADCHVLCSCKSCLKYALPVAMAASGMITMMMMTKTLIMPTGC